MDVSFRKVAGQMALIFLPFGALIAADKPEMDQGKVIAKAETASNLNPATLREITLNAVKEANNSNQAPPKEAEQQVAAAGEIYDVAIAKGMNPELSSQIAVTVASSDFKTLGSRVEASKEVINTVDLGQTTLSAATLGNIYSEIITAKTNGLAPDKIQEITTNLVSLGPKIETVGQNNSTLADVLLANASTTLQQGGLCKR